MIGLSKRGRCLPLILGLLLVCLVTLSRGDAEDASLADDMFVDDFEEESEEAFLQLEEDAEPPVQGSSVLPKSPLPFFKQYFPGQAPMQTGFGRLMADGKSVRVKKGTPVGDAIWGPYDKDLELFEGEMLLRMDLTIDKNGRRPEPSPEPSSGPSKRKRRLPKLKDFKLKDLAGKLKKKKPAGPSPSRAPRPDNPIVATIYVYACCGDAAKNTPALLNVRRRDFRFSSAGHHAGNTSTAFYLPFRISPYSDVFQSSGAEFKVKTYGNADIAIHAISVGTYPDDDQALRKQVRRLSYSKAASYDFIPAASHRYKHAYGRQVLVPAEDLGYGLARRFDQAKSLGLLGEGSSSGGSGAAAGVDGWHIYVGGEGGANGIVSFGPYSQFAVKGRVIPVTVYLRLGAGSGVDYSGGGGGVLVDRFGSKDAAARSYDWLGYMGDIFSITVDVAADTQVVARRDLSSEDFRRLRKEERERRLKQMKRQKKKESDKKDGGKGKRRSFRRGRRGSDGSNNKAVSAPFEGKYSGTGPLLDYYRAAYAYANAGSSSNSNNNNNNLSDSYYLSDEEYAETVDEALRLPVTIPVHLFFSPPFDDSLIEVRVWTRDAQRGQIIHLATTVGVPPADPAPPRKATPSPSPTIEPSSSPTPSVTPSASPSSSPSPTPAPFEVDDKSPRGPGIDFDGLFAAAVKRELTNAGGNPDDEDAGPAGGAGGAPTASPGPDMSGSGSVEAVEDRRYRDIDSLVRTAAKKVGLTLEEDKPDNDSQAEDSGSNATAKASPSLSPELRAIAEEKKKLATVVVKEEAEAKAHPSASPKPPPSSEAAHPSAPAATHGNNTSPAAAPASKDKKPTASSPSSPPSNGGTRKRKNSEGEEKEELLRVVTRTKRYRLKDGSTKEVVTTEKASVQKLKPKPKPKQEEEAGPAGEPPEHDGGDHHEQDGAAANMLRHN